MEEKSSLVDFVIDKVVGVVWAEIVDVAVGAGVDLAIDALITLLLALHAPAVWRFREAEVVVGGRVDWGGRGTAAPAEGRK